LTLYRLEILEFINYGQSQNNFEKF
jgi:hypothetical protein